MADCLVSLSAPFAALLLLPLPNLLEGHSGWWWVLALTPRAVISPAVDEADEDEVLVSVVEECLGQVLFLVSAVELALLEDVCSSEE